MPRKFFPFLLSTLLSAVSFCCAPKPKPPVDPPKNFFEAPQSYPAFDGTIAFDFIERQVAFGPRVPNSKAHDDCQRFIVRELEHAGAKVRLQQFNFPGYDNTQLALTNVLASFHPERTTRIMLCAHWDSRPWADEEENRTFHSQPIVGANDGASGVAVLLTLAKIFRENPLPIGVDMVFFDGEDYGKKDDINLYCIGSKYFSVTEGPKFKPLFAVLLDLVGDKNARFPQEGYSVAFAPEIVKLLWSEAKKLGIEHFVDERTSEIYDDHHSMNTLAGIKTIDIIDVELIGHQSGDPMRKYWHTRDDVPSHCSKETLGSIGKLLCYIIYGIRPV